MLKAPRLTTVVSGLLLIGAFGCGNKEAQIVGRWKFKDVALPASLANDPAAMRGKQLRSNLSYDFKPDKTYSVSGAVTIEGTWSLAGSALTFTPIKIGRFSIAQLRSNPKVKASGRDPGKPATYQLSDDGKTLTAQSGLVLTKNGD